jgi:hypothetical protein
MTNPLDDSMETFEIAKSAFEVVRRVLDGVLSPESNTVFYGQTARDGYDMLDKAEKEIEKLFAFSLFATFERTLRDHLASNLSAVRSTVTIPAQLAVALHSFLYEGSRNWNLDRVTRMFSPPVNQMDLDNAKDIRAYRHHVAHGAAPPTAIPPVTAYRQLTAFLSHAGLI